MLEINSPESSPPQTIEGSCDVAVPAPSLSGMIILGHAFYTISQRFPVGVSSSCPQWGLTDNILTDRHPSLS